MTPFLIRAWLAVILTVHAFAAGPQDPAKAGLPALQVQTERDGLPNGTLHALALDARGRLWVGTQDGAAWFNGRAWHSIPFPKACRSRYIRALALTPDGSAWFGTQDDGLWQLAQDGTWTRHGADRGLPARRINHLRWAREGEGYSLWAATADAGVARYLGGSWTTWGPAEGLKNPWVWRTRPGLDRVWVAGMGGLYSLVKDRIEPARPDPPVQDHEYNDVLDLRSPGGGGSLWISCWGLGLLRWDGSAWERHEPSSGFASKHAVILTTTLRPDGTRVIWAGTYEHGLLFKAGEGPWESLSPQMGFPASGIYDLLEDPRHHPDLWIAMRSSGLGALDAGGWSRFDLRPDFPRARVLSIAEDGQRKQGALWFGTEQGILHWDGGRWVHQEADQGFPSPVINVLMRSETFGGRMVAGGLKGLVVQEGERWRLAAGVEILKAPQVTALLERVEEGTPALWVGSEGGLSRYCQGRWTFFTRKDGLPHDWIYALAATLDRDGTPSLWAGTRGGGVGRYRDGKWTAYSLEAGLPNTSVYSLLAERLPNGRQRLWAGTFGGGLAWMDPNDPSARWSVFNTETQPALPGDVIVGIQKDGAGRIYVMTNRGVARLEGPPGTDPGPAWRVTTYTEDDGLPNRLCNAWASCVDSLGRLWVGTGQGVTLFNPGQELPPQPLAPPLLEACTVGGRSLGTPSRLELGQGQGNLVLEYNLPVFIRSKDVRYQTQLLGLEDQPGPWSPDAKRELTGLGPGRYVLRVRARDHLGRETEALDIPFRIRPYPWRSPWALALYGLLALLAVAGFHRLRVNWLEGRNRELEAKVRAATSDLERQKLELMATNQRLAVLDETKSRMLGVVAHDLRNPLNAVMINADFLTEPDLEPKEVQEVGAKIRQCADFMHELLRRFLDLEAIEGGRLEVNLAPVDLHPIIQHALEAYGVRAMAKGIHLVAAVPDQLPPIIADGVFLQEVLDNLISNAIKFTPKGPPLRQVTVSAGTGWVAVQDEGPGFTPEDQNRVFGQFARLSARPTAGESSTGLGLAIVKSLVETMGGRVGLESEPGRGACFRLTFQLAVSAGPAPVQLTSSR